MNTLFRMAWCSARWSVSSADDLRESLPIKEEKRFVLFDWPAQHNAILVLIILGPGCAESIVEEIVGVEISVSEIFVRLSVP